jgi:hypothetical protein
MDEIPRNRKVTGRAPRLDFRQGEKVFSVAQARPLRVAATEAGQMISTTHEPKIKCSGQAMTALRENDFIGVCDDRPREKTAAVRSDSGYLLGPTDRWCVKKKTSIPYWVRLCMVAREVSNFGYFRRSSSVGGQIGGQVDRLHTM